MRRFLTILTLLWAVASTLGLARGHRHKAHRVHRHARRVASVAASLPEDFFAANSLQQGRATYYRHSPKGGACTIPSSDSLVVAMNGRHYGNSELCGACVEVQGPSGSVVARVVDRCIGCSLGSLDLSRAAFARVAPLSSGRIDVAWRVVPCAQDTVMTLHRTANSSAYWNSLQLRGHGVPIRGLEVRTDSAWLPLERQAHNRYVSRRLPAPPWTVRVTDVWNRTVVDSFISPAPGQEVPLRVRFPDSLPVPGRLGLVQESAGADLRKE